MIVFRIFLLQFKLWNSKANITLYKVIAKKLWRCWLIFETFFPYFVRIMWARQSVHVNLGFLTSTVFRFCSFCLIGQLSRLTYAYWSVDQSVTKKPVGTAGCQWKFSQCVSNFTQNAKRWFVHFMQRCMYLHWIVY